MIKNIQFTVAPKPGSVTRPLSGIYTYDYMVTRGYLVPPSQKSSFQSMDFTTTLRIPLP